MEKLKRLIADYGRWSPLSAYTDRIEAHIDADFSHSLENAKAILETIAKEICGCKGVAVESDASINSILKKAFGAIGYSGSNMITQISSALATIGQNIGELRNEIGPTSHGRSLQELRTRNDGVDAMTREFLIDTTVVVACFLIRTFEGENPRTLPPESSKLILDEEEEFNSYWDDLCGDITVGGYSYSASEVLYRVDYTAYANEHKAYSENESGDE